MPFDGLAQHTVSALADATVEPRNERGWPKTNRQLEWAYLHVVEGMSAYSAALKAGYSSDTAKAKSHLLPRLLAPFIAHLQGHKNRVVESDLEVTVEHVLREAAAIALADVIGFKRVVRINGLERWIGKTPSDLTRTQRMAVHSWVEAEVVTDDGVEIDYCYRLHNKEKALSFVGRHLGMFSETLILDARNTRDDVAFVDHSNVPDNVLASAIGAMEAVQAYASGDGCNAPTGPDMARENGRRTLEARRSRDADARTADSTF